MADAWYAQAKIADAEACFGWHSHRPWANLRPDMTSPANLPGTPTAAGAEDPADAARAPRDAGLRQLEGVVARRLEADADPDDVAVERAIMAEDRARLAAALDAASARLAEVEAASRAVGHRLERAIGTVEGVLARPGA